MDSILAQLPNAGNVVAYVAFLLANYLIIKKQVEQLTTQGNQHQTNIAVIQEQVGSVKAKIENGLSSQIKETSERVARIEGHCQALNCKGTD